MNNPESTLALKIQEFFHFFLYPFFDDFTNLIFQPDRMLMEQAEKNMFRIFQHAEAAGKNAKREMKAYEGGCKICPWT